ncbi:MAG: hypothetical protein E7632_03820 [Ruminococcaceae bacterium]|nr:hypothetical protein [Oscillospiraceae bacterium]
MKTITSYIRVDNKPLREITNEEKKNLQKFSIDLKCLIISDDVEKLIRRIYAKAIAHCFDAYAEETDIYVTVLLEVTDDVLDGDIVAQNQCAFKFHFNPENNRGTDNWNDLMAYVPENIPYLNISVQVFKAIYDAQGKIEVN